MKRIIGSSIMVMAVLAVVVGGTGAFFTSQTTSTGNVFTAGNIDLKVNHTRQTYNGVDCETCNVLVYSSASTKVIGTTDGVYGGPFPVNAQLVASPHSAWLNESTVTPAEWIWVTPVVAAGDLTNDAEYTFEDTFFLQGPVALTDFDLEIASDNGYKIVLNGVTIVDRLTEEFTYSGPNPLTGAQPTAFENALIQNGLNSLRITVRNHALSGSTPASNPAGLIYRLEFKNEDCKAGVADFQLMCRLWNPSHLTAEHKFFNFSDVKPQDRGTNLISMVVEDNQAYICLNVADKENKENTHTAPEIAANDTTSGPPQGEIGQHLMVVGWRSDNLGNKTGLPLFVPTNVNDLNTITFADSTTSPVNPGVVQYIHLEWCFGQMTLSGNNVTCNGNVPNINQTQTDAFLADLQFFAVQSRNNNQFRCSEAFDI